SVGAVICGWETFFPFLVFAFLLAETAGILFTVKDAGTLTDTTAKYVPEDLTFIIMGGIFWRVTKWGRDWRGLGSGWAFVVWILVAWLVQHFIVHYARASQERPTGWLAPRKVQRWWRVSVRPTSELQPNEQVAPSARDFKDDEIRRQIFASVVLLLISLAHL